MSRAMAACALADFIALGVAVLAVIYIASRRQK